jgi:hypothetical protein
LRIAALFLIAAASPGPDDEQNTVYIAASKGSHRTMPMRRCIAILLRSRGGVRTLIASSIRVRSSLCTRHSGSRPISHPTPGALDCLCQGHKGSFSCRANPNLSPPPLSRDPAITVSTATSSADALSARRLRKVRIAADIRRFYAEAWLAEFAARALRDVSAFLAGRRSGTRGRPLSMRTRTRWAIFLIRRRAEAPSSAAVGAAG